MLISVEDGPSNRLSDYGNRNASARGIQLPFHSAQGLRLGEAEGPNFHLINAAIGEFDSAHPYLLFDRGAIGQIRKRAIANSKLLTRLEQSLREEGSDSAKEESRTRIKRRSRQLIHIAFLSLIGDGPTREDALRATRNILSALAAEESWSARPVIKSFLDRSEMAVAVALAYDWLYEALSREERRAVEQALLRHVIEPALAAYADRFMLWPKRRDNCTLVSNAGILVAALAVLGRYPDARQLIEQSLASSWRIFDTLAPDGGWAEGLSYWSLAMRYAGLMVAAIESTFGQSFGLADRPGFAQTWDFALHAAGTFGAAFNFGDSEPRFDVAPLAWFAHRFKRPSDARLIDRYDGWFLPFTVIWADRSKAKAAAAPPTGKVFHSSSLACFRNTWSCEKRARPVYLAIKGGNVSGSASGSSSRPEDLLLHAQADAGSFIIDGARRRWIIDLGPDDYDLPGYFDHGADNRSGLRWRYYRTQTAGHNTLVIDGRNQIPNARAPIVGSCIDGKSKWAVFDLSAAYGRPAGSVRRGAALIGRQVLIQDEVAPEVSGSIAWVAHTTAEPVSVAGAVARFRLGSDRFVLRILEPGAACFDLGVPPEPRSFPIADVRQLHSRPVFAGESSQISEFPRRAVADDGSAGGALIRRLQIVWPKGIRRLSVVLLPDFDDDEVVVPLTPLGEWLSRRPVRLARYRRPEYWSDRGREVKRGAAMGASTLKAGIVRQQLSQRIAHA